MKTLVITIVLGLTLQLYGCITLPRIVAPSKPETTYNYSEEIVTTPKAVVVEKDGSRVVVVQEQTKRVDASYTVPKKGFMQRLGNWLGSLSILGVIILVVCLVLFPGATLGYLVKQVFKWKNALTETAAAIKVSKAVEKDNALELALKEKQSDETKELLGKIRAKL